jgi:hypothetical protein
MNNGRRLLGLATMMALCGLAALAGGSCDPGDNTAPKRVTDLQFFFDADAVHHVGLVTGTTQNEPANTRILAWTATGDDKNKGRAAKYDIRYIKSSDLPAGTDGAAWMSFYFDAARQLIGEIRPRDAGRFQEMLLPRIDTGDTVWFAMRVTDEVGQDSKLSNIAGPLQIKRLTVPVRPAAGVTATAFGQAVANAHDYNADGLSDFLVGSPAEGKAYLYPGTSNYWLMGLKLNIAGLSIYRAALEITPTITYTGSIADEFGAAVAGLGNVNGDYYADLAIGAPGYNGGAGRVYLDFGSFIPSPLTWDQSVLDVRIEAEAAGDRFGAAIASAGDLNLDTFGDVVVGAPGALAHRGKAYIFSGGGIDLHDKNAANAMVKIIGENPGDSVGAVVAPLGDVNGDGISDVAVAAPDSSWGGATHSGAVYIFYGGLGLMYGHTIDLAVTKADVTIRGTVTDGRFGRAIAAAGVLSAHFDSARDFVVAGGDTVYVFIGGSAGVPAFLTGSGPLQYFDTDALVQLSRPAVEFAAAVACPGDLDNDGFSELLIGAPGEDTAYIFSGPITATASGAAPDEVLTGAAGTRFGETLTGVGDFNLDGYADFLIGAPTAGEAFFNF